MKLNTAKIGQRSRWVFGYSQEPKNSSSDAWKEWCFVLVIRPCQRTPEERTRSHYTYLSDKLCCYPHNIPGETNPVSCRILNVEIAIKAFTQALFDLAASPSFAPVLREEVETVIKEEGYSKMSLHRMVKLDSFIKESQRLRANNACTFTNSKLW